MNDPSVFEHEPTPQLKTATFQNIDVLSDNQQETRIGLVPLSPDDPVTPMKSRSRSHSDLSTELDQELEQSVYVPKEKKKGFFPTTLSLLSFTLLNLIVVFVAGVYVSLTVVPFKLFSGHVLFGCLFWIVLIFSV